MNCYFSLTRKNAAAANKRKDDGQLDGEKYFSGCLSFRQRVVAKKAFETNKENKFSFFNQFFDAVVGILLADSVQPEANTFVCRRCSRETRGNESSTKSNFFWGEWRNDGEK